jgi:hypothetical protein
MREPKDHKTPDESLAAALEWVTRLEPDWQLVDITFGQRNPQTVGPDRHYWYADLQMRVCNNMSGIQASGDTLHKRVALVGQAWREYYHPETSREGFE